MHWSALPLTDQIFTHVDEASGLMRTFAASALRRFAASTDAEQAGVERTEVMLDPAACEMLATQRGLEAHRLARAGRTRHYAPLLFALMPDQSALLVDGSHTYVAAYLRGLRTLQAYLVPACLWPSFLVSGLPEVTERSLLASFSGIS